MSKSKKIILTLWIVISFSVGIYSSLSSYGEVVEGLISGMFYLIPFGVIAFVLIKIWDKK